MNSERFNCALNEISDDLIDAAAGAYERKNDKKKQTTGIVIDLPKTNRTAIRSYMVAAIIYAIAGFYFFYNDFT